MGGDGGIQMDSEANELSLPAGAQRLFELVVPLLIEFIPPDQLLLGGETALTARWKHRESFDIDLFTSQSAFTRAIYRQSGRIASRINDLGLSRVATLGPRGCTLYLDGGKVDLVAGPPLTDCNRSSDLTGDPTIALETTVEILAKKLHGRMITHGRLVPRDLYDLAYARRFEPEVMDEVWAAGPVLAPDVLVAALSSCSPRWMERHDEPLVKPRFPDLRDNAADDMLGDVLSRFPQTLDRWRGSA